MAVQPLSTQMSEPPAAPVQNPMATHVKVIAILEIVWGALAAIGALMFLFWFGLASAITGGAGAPSFVPGILASLGIVFGVLLGAIAVLALLGGTRLLKLRRSGKVPTYICAAGSLLSFPLGTAFGIYVFVILTRNETDQLLVNP